MKFERASIGFYLHFSLTGSALHTDSHSLASPVDCPAPVGLWYFLTYAFFFRTLRERDQRWRLWFWLMQIQIIRAREHCLSHTICNDYLSQQVIRRLPLPCITYRAPIAADLAQPFGAQLHAFPRPDWYLNPIRLSNELFERLLMLTS